MSRADDLNSDIRGSLHSTVIPDGKETILSYTTISYAWGPVYEDGSHLNDFIICDGLKLRVTSNLKEALRRMRELPQNICSDFIWADAICINQEDMSERSLQVTQMARIYRRAASLVVWLGLFDAGSTGERQAKLIRNARLTTPWGINRESYAGEAKQNGPAR